MKAFLITTLTAILGASAMSAHAAEPAAGSWDVQVGPAYIDFHENIALSVSGAPVPGAGGKAQDNTTLAAEVTYHVTPSWSAAVTVGFPPRSNITGTGTAEPFGSLGAVRYAPIALLGKYQLNTESAWHPYLGAGGVYYAVVKESDGFVSSLKVDNKFGTALQAGVNYDLTSGLGVFFDLKKFYVKTKANGSVPSLGGAPAHADVTLDPTVFQVGITRRF